MKAAFEVDGRIRPLKSLFVANFFKFVL